MPRQNSIYLHLTDFKPDCYFGEGQPQTEPRCSTEGVAHPEAAGEAPGERAVEVRWHPCLARGQETKPPR